MFPYDIVLEADNLERTYWGQFGTQELGFNMYSWPLLWTGSYTGKYRPFDSSDSAHWALRNSSPVVLT